MKTCPRCQQENSNAAKFCTRCGEPLAVVSVEAEPPPKTRPMTVPENKGGDAMPGGTVPELHADMPEPDLASLPEGTEIGSWRIERSLGKGGMGRVYLARHATLGNTAALKALSPGLTNDSGFRARFRREATTQAALQHPHIARVFDFVEQDGAFYIVIEHLSGGTVRELIKHRKGPLELSDALRLASEALAGLEYAHQQHVIHRDITSSNVMLDHLGDARITDFGIARISGAKGQTTTGLLGTPHYMSPEQIKHPQDLDARTDIYSMGIVLYEMLTGKTPFDSNSQFEVMRAQVTAAPPLPRNTNPKIPIELERIVLKALQKEPALRYSSCAEFSKAIEDFRAQRPGAKVERKDKPVNAADDRRHNTPPQPQPQRRPIPTIKIGMSVAAIVLAVILFSVFGKGSADSTGPDGAADTAQHTAPAPDITLERAMSGHTSSVLSVAFSPDGQTLASGSADNTLRFWSVATGAELRQAVGGYTNAVNHLAFSPDGRTVASANQNWTIKLWSAATGSELHSWKAHEGSVASVVFSPDGKTLASVGELDPTIKFWSAESGQLMRSLTARKNSISVLAYADAWTLASGGLDGLKLWSLDLAGYGHEERPLSNANTRSIAVSPDGQTLAAALDDGPIQLWSTATGTVLRTLKGQESPTEALAFSKDGKRLVSVGRHHLKLWSVASGESLKTLTGNTDYISVAFSPDGERIAAGELDINAKIMIWRLKG